MERLLSLTAVGLCCATISGGDAWSRPRLTVTVSGQLVDSPTALASLIERLLNGIPIGPGQRARVLLRAVACPYAEQRPAAAPTSAPADGSSPAVPLTTSVPADGMPDEPQQSQQPSPALRDESPATQTKPSDPPQKESLEQRLERLIGDQLGYCVVNAREQANRLAVRLRRFRVVRRVSVHGNWPIFEEEFLRRLSFRPGQRVPEGPELTRALQNQQDRLKRFLARHGYFEGKLSIKLSPPDRDGRVDVNLRIKKGRSYKVGHVVVEPMGAGGSSAGTASSTAKWEPAVSRESITQLFRDQILFYRRGFNTERCKKHVEKLIETYHERGYPGVRIKDDCTKLPKQIDERGVRITLQVQQRRRIVIRYSGNDQFSDSELGKSLTLAETGAYDSYELAQSAEQLHKKYQSEGFLQARIRFSRHPLPDRDEVTFHIDEGPRFHVQRITFVGNHAISEEKLREAIRTRTYPLWGLGEGGYVTDVQLRQDTRRIADLYRAAGFSRVSVRGDLAPSRRLLGKPGALGAAVAAGAATRGDLFVRFTVEEGPRTIVEQIEIHGATVLAPQKLLEQIPLRPQRAFSTGLLADSVDKIKRLYFENGRPYVQVDPTATKIDPKTGHVSLLRIDVREGAPVRFGPVLLRGNPRTRASVIRSALGLKEGEPFDIRRLERGELKLRQLGVFNSVRIQILGLQSRLAEVPVLATIEERYDDHGAIELGVGGSTDNSVFGAIGYKWNNAFGFAANLGARAEVGPQIQSGNLDAVYPRAFGSEYGLDLQLFIRNELTERLGPLLTYGGALTVSREILRDLRALLSYSLRRVETDEPVSRPAGDFDEAANAPVATRTGAFGASLIYDKRDNPLAPSRGYRFAGQLSWASEYFAGTADFLKLRLNGQAYVPLPLDLTIAFGVRYDHGFPLRGADLLPRVERFFAGGDTTIRGFEEDAAFAERIEGPLAPLEGPTRIRLVPQGGNIRLLTNLEIQFPIWKESWLLGLPLMGALFLDNGLVTNSFDRFAFSEFRHGLGAAVRIVTLVGFFSVEYAFPLDPQVGDPKNGRFHLNFGFIF